MNKRTRMSFNVDSDKIEKYKIKCIKDKINMSDKINELIEKYLKEK